MLSRSKVSREQLCETEVVLSTLKTQGNLVHHYNAEVDLLIEDGDFLRAEIEANAAFDKNACTSIARLQLLIKTYRQKRMSRRFLTLGGPLATTTSRIKLPNLQLPSFAAHTLNELHP